MSAIGRKRTGYLSRANGYAGARGGRNLVVAAEGISAAVVCPLLVKAMCLPLEGT